FGRLVLDDARLGGVGVPLTGGDARGREDGLDLPVLDLLVGVEVPDAAPIARRLEEGDGRDRGCGCGHGAPLVVCRATGRGRAGPPPRAIYTGARCLATPRRAGPRPDILPRLRGPS